ncbi:uncharacterized protein ACA1_159180 [Acanthamoeba castellanii str. Neff]|uniref:Tetratricopeptide repeat domain containing protein n=1 Tax=Acanthamoeba castellanii (strain ATCC 30010 / Neff) TaxID=1257118 RepID=L8HAC0_ACACF|nr:uncharacterized protein ACA1_159180 [Acanthamoeba castellanii str. Neff]ELR22120.1 hypothetical protein ACA1_159180 [Acanthamoeba castellanii str. Neff]
MAVLWLLGMGVAVLAILLHYVYKAFSWQSTTPKRSMSCYGPQQQIKKTMKKQDSVVDVVPNWVLALAFHKWWQLLKWGDWMPNLPVAWAFFEKNSPKGTTEWWDITLLSDQLEWGGSGLSQASEKVLAKAKHLNEKANKKYQARRFEEAIKLYTKALELPLLPKEELCRRCNQANGVKTCSGKVVYNFNTSTCYAYSGYYLASDFTNLFIQYVNQPGTVGWATFFFTSNQCLSSTLTSRIGNYTLGCFEVKGPHKTNHHL